jgi:hypothetical protein
LEHENKARVNLLKISDATLACAALIVAVYIRAQYPNAWDGYTENSGYYWPLALVCLVFQFFWRRKDSIWLHWGEPDWGQVGSSQKREARFSF